MQTSRQRRVALRALLAGAVGIGFAPVLVRLSEVGPSATAFFRVLFALPFLWLWVSRRQASDAPLAHPKSRKDFFLLALAGLFFTGDLAIWHWSLQLTTVANSTLLANTAPIFVTIGAAVFFREKITVGFIVGMAIAFGGAALLVMGGVELSAQHLRGDLLAIAAAVFYAGYLLVVKQLRERLATPAIMAWSGLVSCAGLLLVAVASGEKIIPAEAKGWLVLAGLGLVSHLGGQTSIAYALGHLPASFSSVSLLLQPFLAAMLAWVVLLERLTLWQWTGGVITLCGIIVAGGRPGAARTQQHGKDAKTKDAEKKYERR